MAAVSYIHGIPIASLSSISGIPKESISAVGGGGTLPPSGPTTWTALPIPMSECYCAGNTGGISVGGGYWFVCNTLNYWGNDYIYKSTNKASSWSVVSGLGAWTHLCCSDDGQYVYASDNGTYSGGQGGVWKSSNYGASFSRAYNGGSDQFNCVACSATGQYVYAADYWSAHGFVYSNNYGVSWNTMSIPTSASAISCSGNGQYIMISITDNQNLWISNNYGASFWQVSYPPNQSFSSAMSTSGQYMLACSWSTYPMFSSNYGVSFSSLTSAPNPVYWCAMNGDGSKLYLATMNNGIFESTNYGASWTQVVSTAQQYWNIRCSRDGYVISIPSSGNMYVYI